MIMTTQPATSNTKKKKKRKLPTQEQLNDPRWRLSHLYKIVDKQGNVIRFRPNKVQLDLLSNLTCRDLVLKARQQGLSTLVQIVMLDQCLFVPNTDCGVIAHTKNAVKVIFRTKIKFAWNNMPKWVRSRITADNDSTNELIFSNGSSIRVATSMRSGTLRWLHVSEFAKLCASSPLRAVEVITGSIPVLAQDAHLIIESTAEGIGNDWHRMCMTALEMQRTNTRTKHDYKLHFYSWHDHKEYELDDPEISTDIISPYLLAYFTELEKELNKTITQPQRMWYAQMVRTFGDLVKMNQEYPSTVMEAFQRPKEGTWFASTLDQYKKHQKDVPYDSTLPVYTAWDLGKHDGCSIWFFQTPGPNIYHYIDYFEEHNKDYDVYAKHLQSLPYVYAAHYIPHDAAHKTMKQNTDDAQTAEQALQRLGLRNTVVVPRALNKVTEIVAARGHMARSYFDQTKCKIGVDKLYSYSREWSQKLACFTDVPKHDRSSEAADSYMQSLHHKASNINTDVDWMKNAPVNVFASEHHQVQQTSKLFGRPQEFVNPFTR